jgi:hypothetical protein
MTGNRIQVVIGELGLVILTGVHSGIWWSVAVICGFAVINGIVGSFVEGLKTEVEVK